MNLGTGYVEVRGDTSKLRSDLQKSEQQVKSSTSNMGRFLSSLKTQLIGVASIYAFQKIAREAITAASNLEEVSSKFNVVFKGQEAQAESWSATLVKSYAMSTRESKQYLSSVQDLLVPMGMAADQAGKMSFEVVKLSADLGSFNNLPTAQVMDDIQSALVGNYETMKKYGVVLNATVVQEKALAMGLADTKAELTAADKAQAAYALMVDSSKAAVGDMERTQGSYANQLKKAKSLTEDMAAALGNALLPYATNAVQVFNSLAQKVLDFAKALEKAEAISIQYEIGRIEKQLAGGGYEFFDAGTMAPGFTIYGNTASEVEQLNKKLEQLKGRLKEIQNPTKEAAKETESLGTTVKETAKDIKITNEQMAKDNEKLWEYTVKAAVKADEEMADAYAQYATYEQDMAKETAKVTAEQAKAEIDLKNRLGSSLKRTDKDYFDYKKRLLDEEKQKYVDLFGKNGDIELINKAFAEDYKRLEIEKLRAAGGFFGGVKAYALDSQQDLITWGDVGYSVVETFANESKRALSDNLFSILKGDFDSLEDAWKGLLDAMLRAFTDMLAEMIVQWTMSGLLNLFTGKGFSGFSLENLVGGTALGEALGIGSTAAGVAGGIGAGAAAGGVGATATVAGGAAFEAFSGAGGATTTAATTAGGYSALGPVAAAILAAPVLGPTMTSAWKSLITGAFGVGKQTAPSAANYLDAINAGLDYVPGWEDMTTGFLSAALARGGAEKMIMSLLKGAGYFFDPVEHAKWDPEGTFIPAFTDPGAGKYADLLEKYKGLKSGIDFIPADGPYYLHRGERVVPAEQNNMTINVPVIIDGKQIGYVVAKQARSNPELINAMRNI